MDATESSPLDVLLMAMRRLESEVFSQQSVDVAKLKLLSDIAKSAAPYVHVRCGTGESPTGAFRRHEDALKELA
jgi:hypothetical protein